MEKFQSKKLDHEKVMRDPVHNYIHAKDQVILDVSFYKSLTNGQMAETCYSRMTRLEES